MAKLCVLLPLPGIQHFPQNIFWLWVRSPTRKFSASKSCDSKHTQKHKKVNFLMLSKLIKFPKKNWRCFCCYLGIAYRIRYILSLATIHGRNRYHQHKKETQKRRIQIKIRFWIRKSILNNCLANSTECLLYLTFVRAIFFLFFCTRSNRIDKIIHFFRAFALVIYSFRVLSSSFSIRICFSTIWNVNVFLSHPNAFFRLTLNFFLCLVR